MFEFGLRFFLRQKLLEPVAAGRWWHPRYFRWRSELRRFPELDTPLNRSIMHALQYAPSGTRYLQDDGARFLVEHDLNSDSLVMDVGAYIGEWSRAIHDRYRARVLAFEPVPQYCLQMERAFAGLPGISVHNFGLSDSNRQASMAVFGLGTSEYTPSRGFPTVTVQIRDVQAVFEELAIDTVDVLKINIEGGEFPLLERMLACRLIPRCRKILVQFHTQFLPTRQSIRWRERLVREIETTHAPVFSYPFFWEGWSLRQ
jgi:FkbM family methyltransferase